MQSKKKLAIFDLDGTLFDTKNVNYYAYKEALEKYEIKLDYDFFCKECNGKKYTQFLPKIGVFSEDELLKIHKYKKEVYSKYLKEAKINVVLFDMIFSMKDNYYIALVTTASRKNTIEILNFFDKTVAFDYIITQDETIYPKPNPEGFIKAINYFGVSNDDVVIFEDSEVGIDAASKCTKNVYKVYGYN